MEIQFLSIGKVKEKYYLDAIKEYSKRLSKYTKVTHIEVKDEKAPANASDKDIEQIKIRESEALEVKLKDGFVIALALNGKMLDSVTFAEKIEEIKTYHHSTIIFLIGGSHGLSDELINKANLKLKFSPMTFPHQLAKVMIMEQVFRAMKILHNEPYHK